MEQGGVPVGTMHVVQVDEEELQQHKPQNDGSAGVDQHERVVCYEVVVRLAQLCQQHKDQHCKADHLCAVDESNGPFQVQLAQILDTHHHRSRWVKVPAGRPYASEHR